MKFDRHLGGCAVGMPVKCQGDTVIMISYLAASRLYEILREDVLVNKGQELRYGKPRTCEILSSKTKNKTWKLKYKK